MSKLLLYFSVVIPTYQRPEMLMQALESVECQTFADYELIVVDDEADHGHAKGGAGARNAGIAKATGEWVAFLDDDDTWAPDKLARVFEVSQTASPDKTFIYHAFAQDGQAWLKKPRYIGPTSTLVARRRALLEIGGFDESLPWGQDIDLCARLGGEACGLHIPDVLAVRRVGDYPSISRSREVASMAVDA